MKNLFLYMLSVPSNPTLMNIAKIHATIVIELAISYEIVMNEKLTFVNLKQTCVLGLNLVNFVNWPTLWRGKLIMEKNEKQHAPIIKPFEAIIASIDMNKMA